MNGFFSNTGNILFAAVFAIQFLAIVFTGLKNDRRALYYSNFVLLIGLVSGLFVTLSSKLFFALPTGPQNSLLNNWIRLDGLSFYFLFVIQLAAIPTTLYNFSYLRHYMEKKIGIKNFILFYILTIISTQVIVIANQAVFFLVCWEVMSISAYFCMILEKEKEEVQKGSFYYFAASHVVVFILYIFFFLLHHQTGSWFLSDYHLSFEDGAVISTIFILSFIGFGIKAGFMPFHFWLPQAHPVAPTVMSAFLSGVIIKTGIYGIIRTFLFIKPVPEWSGWLVLIVSMISAVFGVWYALAQHDIKKLLAYHSVENIGIIGIGIGIGFIGSANNLPAVEFLGFGGALLHTLNHAIFKSLLFIGSGIVCQNLDTRNIELMGGLVHRAGYIALFFLIGSVAISGIPPLNGFISEFVIFTGFFSIAGELKNYYPILMLIMVVGLAFVGGLAVACFTKVNAIIFLGSERKEVKHFHTTIYDYLSLGIFAALCIAIGFYPAPFVEIVQRVIAASFNIQPSSTLINMDWFYLSAIFGSIVLGIAALLLVKLWHHKKYGSRVSGAWACGYENLSPRMQYTASSFADEINTISGSILLYNKEIDKSEKPFPTPLKFESHSRDFVDRKLAMPAYGFLKSFISKIGIFNQTDIRYYIAFILIIITIYSLIAFLWT
ncbi:MAG: hypothetical protein JXR46_05760 [Calditrichaceae bacterium]|nr:hypothetical protein [Calditrichaceae bacterium]MBN2708530.1 hypothetical protein [Calditrichaceae bacterium]RQV93485.1 MAG: hypothetical protein EH224_12370 [Calditrichota bacterium]